MRGFVVVTLAACLSVPASAQQNPFKIKGASQPVAVSYAITGSMTGTAEYAATKDKFVRHSTTTGKMFGKTATTDQWTLMTPETIYSADLARKQGTRTPNMLPTMAKAYDQLDGTEKTRFAQNMKDMAQVVSQAFGATGLTGPDAGSTATYAGHTCVEHTMGSFSSCMMKEAPQVPLHESGSMFCVDYEQTATTVSIGAVPSSAFDLPAGVEFKQDTAVEAQSDSMARTMVRYFASQQLADSLAAAKAKMKDQPAGASEGQPAMHMDKADCEKLRNLDLGKMMSNSFNSVVTEAVNEAVQEKEAEMKNNAKNKIKGIIKKPKLF
jgi:hypothetical protein